MVSESTTFFHSFYNYHKRYKLIIVTKLLPFQENTYNMVEGKLCTKMSNLPKEAYEFCIRIFYQNQHHFLLSLSSHFGHESCLNIIWRCLTFKINFIRNRIGKTSLSLSTYPPRISIHIYMDLNEHNTISHMWGVSLSLVVHLK